MNREIKFRVWKPLQKRYDYIDRYSYEEGVGFLDTSNGLHNDNNVWEQFTGLHDKNGVEIYKNDVVKWDDCSNGEYWRFAVVQINPDIQFNCSLIEQVGEIKNSSKHIFRLAKFAYEDTENYLEVIGNIYQNPELIK